MSYGTGVQTSIDNTCRWAEAWVEKYAAEAPPHRVSA
jgi:hypothetical protein